MKTVIRWVHYLRVEKVETPNASSRSRERYRPHGRSGLAAIAARGIQMLTSLVEAPLALHFLSADPYDMRVAMSSLVSMLGCAVLGIGKGLHDAISDVHSGEDWGGLTRHVSSAFFSLTGVALMAIVAFGMLCAFPSRAGVFNVKAPLAVADSASAVSVLVFSPALWVCPSPRASARPRVQGLRLFDAS